MFTEVRRKRKVLSMTKFWSSVISDLSSSCGTGTWNISTTLKQVCQQNSRGIELPVFILNKSRPDDASITDSNPDSSGGCQRRLSGIRSDNSELDVLFH